MPFTHHCHSGQFCNHATDSLEDVVKTAIARHMSTITLTEHIPRGDEDLYPGEETHPHYIYGMWKIFDDYYQEATRLQIKYRDDIEIYIGFEGEWIRDESKTIIEQIREKYKFDLFLGSVHHVHYFPIDYDDETYRQAREIAGGSDERLAEDYFDAQLAMLKALRPPVVSHFDLIRLKADEKDVDWRTMKGVWERIERNLRFVVEYGGLLEINTSALRKGLQQPYPRREICQVGLLFPSFLGGGSDTRQTFIAMAGRLTLSDDSHGIDQIGTNYDKALAFIEEAGIEQIYYMHKGKFQPLSLTDLKRLPFWRAS